MPGVEHVYTIYSNDFTQGVLLDLSLTMKTATLDQVKAVVHRVNELVGNDFDGYQRSDDFIVAPQATVKTGSGRDEAGSHLDADRIADGTRRLRQLRDLGPDGELDLFLGSDAATATLRDVPSTDEAITATRTALGDLPVTVDIYPDPNDQRQHPWKITFPFTPDQEATIRHQIDLPGMSFGRVTVDDGHLTQVTVSLPRPATAYGDIKRLIAAIGPTTEHPLMIDFASYTDSRQDQLRFGGTVDVGACGYVTNGGEQHPEKYYTPESIALQNKLRAEFDTCPK